jgi:hypothetical protein
MGSNPIEGFLPKFDLIIENKRLLAKEKGKYGQGKI